MWYDIATRVEETGGIDVTECLSDYDKQWYIDHAWLDENETKLAIATDLLISQVLGYRNLPQTQLDDARQLVDKANAIYRKYPVGVPYHDKHRGS